MNEVSNKTGIKGLIDEIKMQSQIDRARIALLITAYQETGDQSYLSKLLEYASRQNSLWDQVSKSRNFSADALELVGIR